jgi:hypothetical protein
MVTIQDHLVLVTQFEEIKHQFNALAESIKTMESIVERQGFKSLPYSEWLDKVDFAVSEMDCYLDFIESGCADLLKDALQKRHSKGYTVKEMVKVILRWNQKRTKSSKLY